MPPSKPASKPDQPKGKSATEPPVAPEQSGMRFEDAYQRLEELVHEMERGDLPLEKLLTHFEEGVKLVKHCRKFLDQAQQRVLKYVEQKDGHWELKDLDEDQ